MDGFVLIRGKHPQEEYVIPNHFNHALGVLIQAAVVHEGHIQAKRSFCGSDIKTNHDYNECWIVGTHCHPFLLWTCWPAGRHPFINAICVPSVFAHVHAEMCICKQTAPAGGGGTSSYLPQPIRAPWVQSGSLVPGLFASLPDRDALR